MHANKTQDGMRSTVQLTNDIRRLSRLDFSLFLNSRRQMLTLAITVLTLSRAFCRFLVQLKTNVSKISISILRADAVNDIGLDGDTGRLRKVGF